MRVQQVPLHAGQNGGGGNSGFASPQGTPGDEKQQHREKSGQGRPDARGPFVLTENGIGRGSGPVLQRRLLEILEVVEPRRDPIAACRHLARNFRIASLVGPDQHPIVEDPEPDRGEDEQGDGEAGTGYRAKHCAGEKALMIHGDSTVPRRIH